MDRLKDERLGLAMAVLNDMMPERIQCPGWYSTAQRVARLQSWSRDDYDLVVDEGLKKYPEFTNLHFERAYFLLPRWYGEEGDILYA